MALTESVNDSWRRTYPCRRIPRWVSLGWEQVQQLGESKTLHFKSWNLLAGRIEGAYLALDPDPTPLTAPVILDAAEV